MAVLDLKAITSCRFFECDRQAMHSLCDGTKSLWSVVGRIHRGDIGKEYLRSADIARRLVAANVLFPGL